MAIGSVEIHDERRLDGTNLIERFVCPFPDKSCANVNTAIHDKCTKIIVYLRRDLVLDGMLIGIGYFVDLLHVPRQST